MIFMYTDDSTLCSHSDACKLSLRTRPRQYYALHYLCTINIHVGRGFYYSEKNGKHMKHSHKTFLKGVNVVTMNSIM